MNNNIFVKIVLFTFCLFLYSSSSVFAVPINNANTGNAITEDQLEKAILEMKIENSKETEKLHEMIIKEQGEALSNKEEMYKVLLDTKNDKIGLLQGNISSILTFLGVAIALFTIFAVWLTNKIRKATNDLELLRSQVDETKNKLDKNQAMIDEQENKAKDLQKFIQIMQEGLNEKIEEEFSKSGKEVPEEIKNALTNELNASITVGLPDESVQKENALRAVTSFLAENQNNNNFIDVFEVSIKINDGFSTNDVKQVLSQQLLRFIHDVSHITKNDEFHIFKMKTITPFTISSKFLTNILNRYSEGVFKVETVTRKT